MQPRYATHSHVDWDHDFFTRAMALAAQGLGEPWPTQDEIQHAQNRLRWQLAKTDEMTVSGPCHLVGLDENEELTFTSLAGGETASGVYLSYR